MEWKTATKRNHDDSPPKITISPETHVIYFNRYILEHIFGDRKMVIVRYDKESEMMAFQPVYEGDKKELYKLHKQERGLAGTRLYGKNLLSQFGIKVKHKLTFQPRWDSKIEWLIINLNGGDDNE